jgi:hypothetical protein
VRRLPRQSTKEEELKQGAAAVRALARAAAEAAAQGAARAGSRHAQLPARAVTRTRREPHAQ